MQTQMLNCLRTVDVLEITVTKIMIYQQKYNLFAHIY